MEWGLGCSEGMFPMFQMVGRLQLTGVQYEHGGKETSTSRWNVDQ